jgi:hypothetical protein
VKDEHKLLLCAFVAALIAIGAQMLGIPLGGPPPGVG